MRFILALFLSVFAAHAVADDIGVVGLFPGKAVLIVGGASPKTYSVGQNIGDGVKLVSVTESVATLDVHGKLQHIAIGQYVSRAVAAINASVTLRADERGHFMAQAQVNGKSLPMLVDTGATMIALSAVDAARMGIDYKSGQVSYVSTANGTAPAYKVKLNTVKIGDIELNQIDALVQETGLPFALLGMSFLNRTEMHRDGQSMTLTRRY